MRAKLLDDRNLRMSFGSLTLWLMPVIAAGVLVMAACHQAGPNPSTASNGSEMKQQNLAQRGERCATDSIPSDEVRKIQKQIQEFQLTEKSVKANTAATRIEVFFHVINKGPDPTRDGNITEAQINAQMEVLNNAYAYTHFQFELSKIDRTTNPQWFEMSKGKAAEAQAKQAVGVKRKDVLNM